MNISAKYEHGVFRPIEDVHLEEGTVVSVLLPDDHGPAMVRPSIKDLPFYGMWQNRTDFGDGPDYVDNLRDNPRGTRT